MFIKTSHEHLPLPYSVTGFETARFLIVKNKAHDKRFPIYSDPRPTHYPLSHGWLNPPSNQTWENPESVCETIADTSDYVFTNKGLQESFAKIRNIFLRKKKSAHFL